MRRFAYILMFALGCHRTWEQVAADCVAQGLAADEEQQCVPLCNAGEGCADGSVCRVMSGEPTADSGTSQLAICCSGAGCPPFVPFSNPCPDSSGPTCVVATIHVSASTNSAPIDIVVHADGSAERTIEHGSQNIPETPKNFPANDPAVEQFLSDLNAAGDVGQYAIVPQCSKSVSFGTTTTVTSGNETSGDVQCLSYDAPTAQTSLASDCNMLAFN